MKNLTNVNTLIQRQKKYIDAQHENLLKQAERLGEQDGALHLPHKQDEQVSPNELLLNSEYQRLIDQCWTDGRPYLDRPHLEFQHSKQVIEELNQKDTKWINQERELIDQDKATQIEHVRSIFQIKEQELEGKDKIAQYNILQAKQRLQQAQDRVGRAGPLIHFKSTFWYLILLLGIGISEVPLNIQIFQKFGEDFLVTIIMACSLGIAIPVLAHFTGVFIKQRKEKKEYVWLGILSVTLFLVFNFGASIFRAFVLAERLGEEPNNLNIIIFTCLNLILFIIGMIAAYFRHDESYELEHSYKHYHKEKAIYDKRKAKLQEQLKTIAIEKKNQLKEIRSASHQQLLKLNGKRQEMLDKRNQAILVYDEILNAFISLEAMLEASYRIAISTYRAKNLTRREDRLSPKAWSQPLPALQFRFTKYAELDPNKKLSVA